MVAPGGHCAERLTLGRTNPIGLQKCQKWTWCGRRAVNFCLLIDTADTARRPGACATVAKPLIWA